jgi:hypothetical protein
MTETTIKVQLIQLLQKDTNTIYSINHNLKLDPNIMHYISFEHPSNIMAIQALDSSFKKAIFGVIQNMLRIGKISEQTYLAAHKIIYESL